jgi:hypothetical protein
MFNRQAALPAPFQAMEVVNRQWLEMVMYDMASLQVRAEWSSLWALPERERPAWPARLLAAPLAAGVLRPCQVDHFRDHLGPHPVHTRQFKRRRSNGRELLPRGSSDAIGGRVYPTRALSSVAEHTLYMGEVPGPIPGAPTIVHEVRDDRNGLKFLRLRRCRFARAVNRATSTMRSR